MAKVHYPWRKTNRLPCLIWRRWGHRSSLRCPVSTVLTCQPSPPFRRVFGRQLWKVARSDLCQNFPNRDALLEASGCEGKSSFLQTAHLNTLTISGPATQNSNGNPLFWGKGWRLFTSGPDGAPYLTGFQSKPASKWARKEAIKQVSKEASKQASNQASQKSMPPNKQASKPKPTSTKNPPWITMSRP